MKITEIHIYPVTPHKGLIAFANLVLENKLVLRSIAVHEKLDGTGYRITYPTKNKSYVFHPIEDSFSKTLEQAITTKAKNVLSEISVRHRCNIAQSE